MLHALTKMFFALVSVRILQRNKTNRRYTQINRQVIDIGIDVDTDIDI